MGCDVPGPALAASSGSRRGDLRDARSSLSGKLSSRRRVLRAERGLGIRDPSPGCALHGGDGVRSAAAAAPPIEGLCAAPGAELRPPREVRRLLGVGVIVSVSICVAVTGDISWLGC
jgi:hypothetical protein